MNNLIFASGREVLPHGPTEEAKSMKNMASRFSSENGTIFYTSDWHIIHKKIIRLTKRPFLSTDEMTHEIIRRYNACVSDTDTCYFLGDIFVAPRDGKSHGEEDILQRLSGRSHQVMTGVTVLRGRQVSSFTEVTDIHFRELSEREIRAYVATGEPMDKAGAYGIQGGAALFCSHMVGDYYNVMGLPVCRLGQELRAMAPEMMGEIL